MREFYSFRDCCTGANRTLLTFLAARFFDLSGFCTPSRLANPGSGVLALLRRSVLASRRREKNLGKWENELKIYFYNFCIVSYAKGDFPRFLSLVSPPLVSGVRALRSFSRVCLPMGSSLVARNIPLLGLASLT